MMLERVRFTLVRSFAFAMVAVCLSSASRAQESSGQAGAGHPSVVLVELFTSESCSDCPAADELLREVNGHTTGDEQLIVGISEHVSYWNQLGWKDPFSSDLYTVRQNDYGRHFGLDGVYTPQMIVNGRTQFVGSDGRALQAALAAEAQRKQIVLRIDSAQIMDKNVVFRYTASEAPAKDSLQLVAVLVDDQDQSNVLRGENSGRQLVHVAVARALVPLGSLHAVEQRLLTLPLPPSFLATAALGHHLILFAQQGGSGAVMGVDSRALR